MNIVIVQPAIIWESPAENLEKYNHLLSGIKNDPDLIVLPEMFTTGFSMNSEKLAVPHENPVIGWMRGKATRFGSAITGSLIIEDTGKSPEKDENITKSFFNRLIFINEEGELSYYDKRHMFRMGGEGDHFTAGKERLIVNYKAWRICPLICYDLRFPVWSRNREEYDLLLYVANWPAARSEVWNTLLRARAIENQSWVIGVNRTGKDGEGMEYNGESQVIDPKGNVLVKLGKEEAITEVKISLEDLDIFRQKFPVWKDRDPFNSEW